MHVHCRTISNGEAGREVGGGGGGTRTTILLAAHVSTFNVKYIHYLFIKFLFIITAVVT